MLTVHNAALRLTKHLFALQSDLFDGTVVEFKELAFKRYNDVIFTILHIDPGKFILVCSASHGSFDEGIGRSEEAFEDIEVFACICVAGELVLALGYSVFETVLTVLVVDSFHEWITEHLVSLAKLGELDVR